MGLIPQNFIDDLIARTDIVALIEGRVPLKKAGRDYQARCPFHDENTPSFTVSPTKQFYHCFGCGAHGNALGFLMEYDRLEFRDAVEELARQQGMELPEEAAAGSGEDSRGIYTALARADEYFRKQLRENTAAQDYLKGRGLTGETAKAFGIGYAPDSWDALLKQVKDEKNALAAGLAKRGDKGVYAYFRGRITFPIRDNRGRTVGFGARSLGDGQPKYLNSPETPVFHKGRNLYGLYAARQANRNLERLLVVEGYMDVVMLAQHGITNSVATLGTATTEEHLEVLFRSAHEVVFCFDGDRAGREAAERALERAVAVMRDGREIRFLFLPEDEDPDSLVHREGADAFRGRLEQAVPMSQFLLDGLTRQADLSSLDGRARLVELARPYLERLSEGAFRTLLIDQVAAQARMQPADLRRLVDSGEKLQSVSRPRRQSRQLAARTPLRIALTRLLEHPEFAADVEQVEALRRCSEPGAALLAEVVEFFQDNPTYNFGTLMAHWQGREELEHLAKLAGSQLPGDLHSSRLEFLDTINHLLDSEQPARRKALLEKLEQGELSATEREELNELLARRRGQKPNNG